VCRRKGCANVEIGWQNTEEDSEADQDGRNKAPTANKPPRLKEPHVRLEPLYQSGI
jgi:hypothetical protein